VAGSEGPSDLTRLYLSEIGRRALLTAEDERRLSKSIHDGRAAARELERSGLTATRRRQLRRTQQLGDQARREFVEANLRLVVAIAGQYRRRNVDLLDLIQEGNIGLVRAVDRFDWRRGNRFSTYAAWWIRQAITRGLDTSARSIRLPVHREVENRALARARQRLEAELHRQPTVDELADASGIALDRVVADLQLPEVTISLSSPTDDNGDGRRVIDVLADPHAESPEARAGDNACRVELERMVAKLPARLAEIVRLRFGLVDGEPRTREQVATQLGVSAERVRQLEQRALFRLRRQAPPGMLEQLLAA
jgi:RNA polymerase sigma factor (sigma-70 family)